ncbi:rho GTPase-activating protein 20-like [Capricornis sumatraensis]|uniref:rho GTPase-activating protein 20-like n=1 Tax=Capricornis sumatraensis TaxID=34865 RepID=UPI00360492C9
MTQGKGNRWHCLGKTVTGGITPESDHASRFAEYGEEEHVNTTRMQLACFRMTREDNQHPPLPPRKQKELFGAPLEDVCDNDTLRTPILEMLSFINQKGPFTEGIFRKPASIKSAIALRNKLNAGHKVNLDDECILVVSSVLKDFLRNIQGSVFSAHLCDKWLAVIDQGNEEEKITATQRLVDQLPRANVVFLRHLFGVLHNIEQHSSSSQMRAHDLGLYLMPSILGLANSGRSAFENLSKKVSLMKFLLENCLKIFGEDITSLFGENSVSCVNSDITDNSEISDELDIDLCNN